jgi:hypothetical protein
MRRYVIDDAIAGIYNYFLQNNMQENIDIERALLFLNNIKNTETEQEYNDTINIITSNILTELNKLSSVNKNQVLARMSIHLVGPRNEFRNDPNLNKLYHSLLERRNDGPVGPVEPVGVTVLQVDIVPTTH